MDHVKAVRPHQATFVPDAMGQVTSDHGWDLQADGPRLKPLIEEAQALGVRVSLFVDPDPQQVKRAHELGAQRIELYTEPYARTHGTSHQAGVLAQYREASMAALALGLEVNAGHDLNLHNLGEFLSTVPGVVEVSIGHALLADALLMGYEQAIKAYLAVIAKSHA